MTLRLVSPRGIEDSNRHTVTWAAGPSSQLSPELPGGDQAEASDPRTRRGGFILDTSPFLTLFFFFAFFSVSTKKIK